MVLNPMDAAIQAVTPAIAAPKFGPLPEMPTIGQRYVVAASGLMLEVRRPWLHAIVPVGERCSTPYGDLAPKLSLLCGKPPLGLAEQFAGQCASHAPAEHAAWITWSEESKQFQLLELDITHRSEERVTYHRPELAKGQWLVVDMHSHGDGVPFFSQTDNHDDRGEVKISLVRGMCRGIGLELRRLCLLGQFIDLSGGISLEEGAL